MKNLSRQKGHELMLINLVENHDDIFVLITSR